MTIPEARTGSNQPDAAAGIQNPGFPPFCPACGAAFAGRCDYCGLVMTDADPAPVLFPTGGNDLTLPFSALARTADPLATLTSWRLALPPGGLLRLEPADDGPARWIIPKRALMRLMERAGFRLVGRGWLRKTWLFRRY